MFHVGVIKLPSQRTLKDYTHFVAAATGFSAAVDQQLIEAADIASSSADHEFHKYVSILVDEMHIKEDLVYNKSTGNNCMGMMH